MNYSKLLAATKSPEILAVIENLPVSANGFFLTAEQMDNVEAALAANETAAADLVTANAALATANDALTAANEQLTTANSALTTANARIAALEAMPGATSTTTASSDPIKIDMPDAMAMDFQRDLMKKID